MGQLVGIRGGAPVPGSRGQGQVFFHGRAPGSPLGTCNLQPCPGLKCLAHFLLGHLPHRPQGLQPTDPGRGALDTAKLASAPA